MSDKRGKEWLIGYMRGIIYYGYLHTPRNSLFTIFENALKEIDRELSEPVFKEDRSTFAEFEGGEM